jgi:hypothetical protein
MFISSRSFAFPYNLKYTYHMTEEREQKELAENVEDLVFENKNINALIKGVEEDLETLKREDIEKGGRAADIVRFTIELNILQDKKRRNLEAINQIIESRKK